MKRNNLFTDLVDDFTSLFYPICCSSCNEPLLKHEDLICNLCYVSLPRFINSFESKNELEKMFEGRIQFKRAFALFSYKKESKVQQLLHQLKYNNQPKIGYLLGLWMANEINYTELKNCDLIVPIPLHPKKEKLRGYNQSMKLAEGLNKILGVQIENKLLFRKTFTTTQTKKRKNERWENVKEVFDIQLNLLKPNSKIILIDDVITTGSTIEACAKLINNNVNAEIYIVSLAFAGLS